MPVSIFFKCQKCGETLKPKKGDCCIFCSYADTKCPSPGKCKTHFCYYRYMPQFLKMPKVQLALAMLLIASTAVSHRPTISTIYVFLLAVGFCILFDLSFLALRRTKLFIPYAAIVSGLIIGLLTSPLTLWYQIATICALAMAGKNFLRISGKHLFNPAGTGLFLAGILFHQSVSWWGVSFQSITTQVSLQKLFYFSILCFPFLVSGLRMRRYVSTFSFLITYSLVSLVFLFHTFSLQTFFITLFDPTVLFFSLVMVPEPMTSPVHLKRQILYGSIIALIVTVLSYPTINSALSIKEVLPDPFIAALLASNLIFFRFH